MSDLSNSIIGRITKGGEKFEVLLEKKKAYDYIEGRNKDLTNILVVEEVFKDAKKGERQTASSLQKAFGTTDIYEITKEILEKGEVQLTTEQKRKMQEEKKKQIIALITANCIDVRTKAPVTQKRVELAMEEVRFHVDPFKKPEQQMEELLDKLRLILPLKVEKVKIAIKIPSLYAAKSYGFIKSYNIKQEEWLGNGDLIVVIELPAGLQGEFYDKINKITQGSAETKVLDK